ncbi:hypothetical protein P168DRAFT_329296 [Aspergillus campestris IBT 28561]|uniref:Zn(2)-C6 fungal-type domain-containing protein n=1 Tax=Aspergillus campestris (strain IBT 28561) TaxID=1392248 RepID=A0A2I1CXM3_ASPC2|nr:uncharacterized protein P168DRAFT_329296 [Aspergillus campestris IBT 28561]PKY02368.1 hypothetical protein P168DRAFT_329296 [Aspergillus campestris IBT 28561]
MDVPSTLPESNSPNPQQHATVESQPVDTWSRPRSVTAACERCRRRKIRCDGNTPCATCRRFSMVCIRHRKGEAQACLEKRVQELEAQVATLSSILSSMQSETVTEDLPVWPSFPIDPSPTDSMSSPFVCPSFNPHVNDGGTPPFDVPRIQIVECANPTPMQTAMSPSGVPVASGSNTASMAIGAQLMPMQLGANLTPPLSASSSPTWEARCSLPPGSFALPSPSRRSSVSSLTLDTNADILKPSLPGAGDCLVEVQGIGVSPFGEEPEHFTVPNRAEADDLLDFICDKAPGLGVPLNRKSLQASLNIMYDRETLAPINSCSASLARFQVYMAMAAALRLRPDVPGGESSLLDNFYRLALEQIQSSQFWTRPLANETALLMVLFARASQESAGLG